MRFVSFVRPMPARPWRKCPSYSSAFSPRVVSNFCYTVYQTGGHLVRFGVFVPSSVRVRPNNGDSVRYGTGHEREEAGDSG
jgi:hypothetical protein